MPLCTFTNTPNPATRLACMLETLCKLVAMEARRLPGSAPPGNRPRNGTNAM
jgi:hypothetical protein